MTDGTDIAADVFRISTFPGNGEQALHDLAEVMREVRGTS